MPSLLVLVQNSLTAPPMRIAEEVNRLSAADPQFVRHATIVIDERGDGVLARALSAHGLQSLRAQDLEGVAIPSADENLFSFIAMISHHMRTDSQLKRQPLSGKGRYETDALWFDRLIWCLSDRDRSTAVSRLIESQTLSRILLIGGASETGMVPEWIVAKGLQTKASVEGRVVGPVVGRNSPIWVHGLHRLTCDSSEGAQSLLASGFQGTISVEEEIGPDVLPISKSGGKAVFLVDVGHGAVRSYFYRQLAGFCQNFAARLSGLIICGSNVSLEIYQKCIGSQLAGVPISYLEVDPIAAARQKGLPLLSCEPWRSVYCGKDLTGIEFGILQSPYQRSVNPLPDWARFFVISQ